MSKVFVTDRANKGLEIVAGKYQFYDGLMKVSDSEAELLAPILTRFYGCKLEDANDADVESLEDVDPTLAASMTRASEGGSQAYVVDAMIEAGKAAGDPNVTGTLSGPGVRVGDEHAQNTSSDSDPDPKNVSNQNIGAESANHKATGGDGTGIITGPVAEKEREPLELNAGRSSETNDNQDE